MPEPSVYDPAMPSAAAQNRPDVARAGGSDLTTLVILVAVIALLYFGREILVPFALAVLLSFALGPPVVWLRRHRVPRVPAVIGVVTLAFLAIFAFGAVVANQVGTLAENLPQYQRNIQAKIRSVQETQAGGGIVERASEMLRALNDEIANVEETATEPATTEAGTPEPVQEPIPVEIQQPDPAPFEVLQSIIGPLLAPLATAGVVIVFVIFILLQREDLRDRVIRLAGSHDLQRTTRALNDAARRVSRYLLMQLIVNATYAIPVAVGLWLIGVPNAILWGLLAMVLRFVPYVGPIVAAVFPLALSVAVDPGWTMLLWTGALFIVLELISNNIVEPWLYGSSTGLSSVAIITAAVFWTWLWGPIGLLLSTPLTVCLVVLGRHVPRLQFLDVLFGNEAVLAPEQTFYQRMLAADPEEATEQAEEFLKEKPLAAFYDEVVLRALSLAEEDRARGALDDDRRAVVAEGVSSVIDNLADTGDPLPAAAEDDAEPPVEPAVPVLAPDWQGQPVLCAAGRGNLDEAAAALLADLLRRQGIGARVVPCEAVAPGSLRTLDLTGVQMVCISYMNTSSLAHARYLCRRLRRRLPHARILVGFWMMDAEVMNRRNPVDATGADVAATSLTEAVRHVVEASAASQTTAAQPIAALPAAQ